jgi:hypothetical protein
MVSQLIDAGKGLKGFHPAIPEATGGSFQSAL